MNIQIESSSKISESLNTLIKHHANKLYGFYDRISHVNIFLKKENLGHRSDKVTLQLGVTKNKKITITEKASRFEVAVVDAFEVAQQKLKKSKSVTK